MLGDLYFDPTVRGQRVEPIACDDERPVVNPPDSVTVYDDALPILYDYADRPLYRAIGFTRRHF
jgi:hypothetical protein